MELSASRGAAWLAKCTRPRSREVSQRRSTCVVAGRKLQKATEGPDFSTPPFRFFGRGLAQALGVSRGQSPLPLISAKPAAHLIECKLGFCPMTGRGRLVTHAVEPSHLFTTLLFGSPALWMVSFDLRERAGGRNSDSQLARPASARCHPLWMVFTPSSLSRNVPHVTFDGGNTVRKRQLSEVRPVAHLSWMGKEVHIVFSLQVVIF
jgi:hypothetical protein